MNTAAAKNAYRQGLIDGYFGNPPEYQFTDYTTPRNELEMERWFAGHSDGGAIRDLDEQTGTEHGFAAIGSLASSVGRDMHPF